MASVTDTSADKAIVNRERAARRRAVARTVGDLRDRLGSPSGTSAAFDAELLLNYARTRLSASYALPLLIVLVGAVASVWLRAGFIVLWVAATLLLHGFTASRYFRFSHLGAERQAADWRRWRSLFVGCELVLAFAWVVLLIAVSRAAGPGLDIFLFATMLAVVAVGTTLGSSLPLAAVAATVPVTLAVVGAFVVRHEFIFLALGLLSLSAEVFFLVLSQRLYAATLASMHYRVEKDHLIAELGTAKAISDESRRRAEEANLAKSRFLATMSHELRTPLNAILGFSEVMKNEVLGPMQNASYKEYAGDIHSSGQHLLNLINEILDLSRIEAGKYELTEEPVVLTDIVQESQDLMRLRAGNKNLIITLNAEPDLPRIWADERAVRQVVLNLLSNAIKFTPAGGAIELKVGWTAGGGQYVSVADNGPGIPEEEIPIVLSTFGQGAIAIKSAEQGTGLGLPIVQAMMQMHDGTFELHSKLREGTEAIACFPRSRVMEALAPIETEKPQRKFAKRWLSAS